MKSKKMTYLLMIAVIAVWGIILYRVFSAAGGRNDEELVTPAIAPKKPFNDYTLHADTTQLLLNYRDPFSSVKSKDSVQIPVNKLVHQVNLKPVQQPINWGFISYAGYIRNAGSKKLVAIIKINGKTKMLSEGEQTDGVLLIKNMKDSIKVNYDKKMKFIALKGTAL